MGPTILLLEGSSAAGAAAGVCAADRQHQVPSRPLDASAINSPDAANPERRAACSSGSHRAREQPPES